MSSVRRLSPRRTGMSKTRRQPTLLRAARIGWVQPRKRRRNPVAIARNGEGVPVERSKLNSTPTIAGADNWVYHAGKEGPIHQSADREAHNGKAIWRGIRRWALSAAASAFRFVDEASAATVPGRWPEGGHGT